MNGNKKYDTVKNMDFRFVAKRGHALPFTYIY